MVTGQLPNFPTFALPYIFCKVDLCIYNYSGHPVYNSQLAIFQRWSLYTGLIVVFSMEPGFPQGTQSDTDLFGTRL